MAKDPNGDIFKEREKQFRHSLPKEPHYLLIRLDGKAFHTYTRGLDKPFDTLLTEAMDETAKALCQQIQGVRLAYTQSDEISLLVTAWKDPESDVKSELWMGGVQPKILSLSAAIATATFNQVRAEQTEGRPELHKNLALFDSRLWTFEATEGGRQKVLDYFGWRIDDCVKNSISMMAQSLYSHTQLHGRSTRERLKAIEEAGESWVDIPDGLKSGRVFAKEERTEKVEYVHKATQQKHSVEAVRGYWVKTPFTYLEDLLPLIPEPPKVRVG